MSFCLNPHCQKAQNPDSANFCLSCGTKLLLRERYCALKPIGQGGFGKTFLAVDGDKPSKPPCVIKQFLPSSQGTNTLEKSKELFNQEAVRLEELGKHSQIPELYAHFEQDSYLYLVQEYIKGQNLLEVSQARAFTEAQIRDLLISLLPVLQFVHDHQTIHRDVKPENIIQRDEDQAFVLVDFGAARYATGTALLKTGTAIGDPRYMAPEQLLGKADFTSDFYCLGVTCLHLLTLVDPLLLFDTSEDQWVWRDFLTVTVSDELGSILDRMVVRATKRRFQSAKEIGEALKVAHLFSSSSSIPSQKVMSPSIPVTSPTVVQSSKVLSSRQQDGKWGYVDETGNFVIPPQYDKAEAFSNGLAKVSVTYQDGNSTRDQWGMINQSGQIVLPIEFSYIGKFSEGLANIGNGDNAGFINEAGQVVIPLKYLKTAPFRDGFAIVRTHTGYGMIDKTEKIIIPCEFDGITEFSNGLARIQKHDGNCNYYGMINKEGKIIIPCEFDESIGKIKFINGLAQVNKRNKWGMITEKGQLVIPCDFDEIGGFVNGLAKVGKYCGYYYDYDSNKEKNYYKYGLIDKSGKIVLPIEFGEIEELFENLVKLRLDSEFSSNDEIRKQSSYSSTPEPYFTSKYGLANKKGGIIVPCEFDEIEFFVNGFAKVSQSYNTGYNIQLNQKYYRYGLINELGKFILPVEYGEIGEFFEDLIRVRIDSQFGDPYGVFKYKSKYGFANKKGEIVIPCEFLEADNFCNGRAKVKKQGILGIKEGYIDKKGNWIK